MRDTFGGMGRWPVPALVAMLFVTGCDDGEDASATRSPTAATAELDPWRDVTDEQLAQEIEAAKRRAAAADKRVLLDFVATWCDDCREVVRVSKLEPAASVLRERYEYVPVNVGNWDRAESLRQRYQIRRIAALVVLEPDGTRVAQTTLEPVSRGVALTPQDLAAWLRDPRDQRPSH